MAKQVSIQLVDDIDGSVIDENAGETIEFSVSVEYVIDLKTKNANEFHRKLNYYIDHGTRVGGRKRKPSPTATLVPAASTGSPAKRDAAQTQAIRKWAIDKGYPISQRGRIPADVEEAYNAAH